MAIRPQLAVRSTETHRHPVFYTLLSISMASHDNNVLQRT